LLRWIASNRKREIFRQRAAHLQGYLTGRRFRIFRNEKLERYKTLSISPALRAYLAANARLRDWLIEHGCRQILRQRIINSARSVWFKNVSLNSQVEKRATGLQRAGKK